MRVDDAERERARARERKREREGRGGREIGHALLFRALARCVE